MKSAKSRENPHLEEVKELIRHDLRRQLSSREEYLIELSAAVLDEPAHDDHQHDRREEEDQDFKKAA